MITHSVHAFGLILYVLFSVQKIVLVSDNYDSSIESRLKKLETSFSGLQEENARVLKDSNELRMKNAEIQKENSDLKVQVVSDGVNYINFSLNISLCSSLILAFVSLCLRRFSSARHQLAAQTHQQTLKENLCRALGYQILRGRN